MSKSKSDLSLTKRVLLDFVKFKTQNGHQFFASNEYIAKGLDLTENTAKTFVNDLIREGYLYKEIDKRGMRILSLTGKEYKPLFEDLRNFDKKVLKEDRDNFQRDNKYLNQQLEQETAYKEQLLNENTDLVLSNAELTHRVQELEKRVTALENIFYKNGMTKEQLEDLLNK
ncbi:MAG: helix-turn-helix domain-containing protein [Alphaproteobacteria bacterium]|nr:helix-turn-helix domain-containing protein [Alphaproteobacteria bacterium]